MTTQCINKFFFLTFVSLNINNSNITLLVRITLRYTKSLLQPLTFLLFQPFMLRIFLAEIGRLFKGETSLRKKKYLVKNLNHHNWCNTFFIDCGH